MTLCTLCKHVVSNRHFITYLLRAFVVVVAAVVALFLWHSIVRWCSKSVGVSIAMIWNWIRIEFDGRNIHTKSYRMDEDEEERLTINRILNEIIELVFAAQWRQLAGYGCSSLSSSSPLLPPSACIFESCKLLIGWVYTSVGKMTDMYLLHFEMKWNEIK